MTTTIQKHVAPPLEFTPEQRQLILNSFLNGASEQEAAVLLELARLRRLNPITQQIHFVKRWNSQRRAEVWSAQVGIDGFRSIAERTGLYDGQDEPEYEYDGKGQLKLCRVRVYRKDWGRPAVGVAHFSEYAQRTKDGNLNTMWGTKPHIMLAKCAEALAFRKAFPEDTSGLYAPEEMGAEERDVTPTPSPTALPATTGAQTVEAPTTGKRTAALKEKVAARMAREKAVGPTPYERMVEIGKHYDMEGEALHSAIKGATGKTNASQLTLTDVQLFEASCIAIRKAMGPPANDDPPPPTDADFPGEDA